MRIHHRRRNAPVVTDEVRPQLQLSHEEAERRLREAFGSFFAKTSTPSSGGSGAHNARGSR